MKNYDKCEENPCGCIFYTLKGADHRLDGPAHIFGVACNRTYHVNNDMMYKLNTSGWMTEQEFNEHPEIIRYINLQKLKEKLGV